VLKQNSRGDNAGVVAPGATKPTSTMGLVKEENRLRVVATLSEPIDKYVLEDNSNLQVWVASELTGAVQSALEQEILSGDGTGEHFTGLANTSGIQTHVATAADRLVTMNQSLSKLETVGEAPSVFVIHPDDWGLITTTRNTSGGFDVGGPVDAATRRAWGVPVALSNRVAVGGGYLLGEGAAVIGRDGAGLRTEWNSSIGFATNEVQARTEGRFSLDVLKPLAVVKINLIPA
ncbi:phage major capsid protein, partial [Arthrobacter pigmenti]